MNDRHLRMLASLAWLGQLHRLHPSGVSHAVPVPFMPCVPVGDRPPCAQRRRD